MKQIFLSTLLRPEWRRKASPGRAGWLIGWCTVLCLSGCAPKEPCDKSVYKNDPKNVAALGYTTLESAVFFEYTDLKTKLVDTLEFRGRLTDTLDYIHNYSGDDTTAYFCKPAWQLKKAHFICTENPRYNFRIYLYPKEVDYVKWAINIPGPWLKVYFYGEKSVFEMYNYNVSLGSSSLGEKYYNYGITYTPNVGITMVNDDKTQTWRLLR